MTLRTSLGIIILLIVSFGLSVHAGILPDGTDDPIRSVSIGISTPATSSIFDVSRDVWLRILTAIRLVVSGFALIYLVLIGVYMIVFSETEERVKSQKNQIIYALIGFFFLNIPWLVYTVFFGSLSSTPSVSTRSIWSGLSTDLWDTTALSGASGFIPQIISFFEVFIFWVAILMFSWGFFRLILSWGDEEIQKKAKNRIVYGILGLMFLAFVKVWSGVVARWDFFGEVSTIWSKLLWLALYFAAPIVIFFLVIWAYYYITSAGDEERTKKAKSIFINTLIAALILLWAYSFLSDLVNFTL
jgi:Type IV secretion system pilin